MKSNSRPREAEKMPSVPKFIDPICAHCEFYQIHIPGPGIHGGPYCDRIKKYHPNPKGWAAGDGSKKPGERTCRCWIKIIMKQI
jgi:hypothetical protein